MTQLFTEVPSETVAVPCYNPVCQETVSPDSAVWYDMGISHYNKAKGVSYIQVHTSPYSCNEECAKNVAHARAEGHKKLAHGKFDKNALNPKDEHPDDLVRQNAEYSPIGRAWSSLPKVDALTGQPLGDDIYVVHLDRSSHQEPKKGLHGYHTTTGELGCSTLDGAIQLIHVIIDEILSPEPVAKEVEQ